MAADGSNPHQIGNLDASEGSEKTAHTFGPTLTKPRQATNGLIAFEGAGSIWIMQKDGTGLKQLIPNCAAPSLALSGTWLTCTVQTSNPSHREIWRINTDGTGLKQLTFPTDPDYPDANASSISPDETTIALYVGLEDWAGTQQFGRHSVAVIPANGGAPKRLTACTLVTTSQQFMALGPDECFWADDPSWTPDGKWVIYHRAAKSGGTQTWMIDLNGRNAQLLFPSLSNGGGVPMKYVN